jgi:hypothetical protein
MFNHYMLNITLDKSINILTNKSIKLSSFIAYLFRKDLLDWLTMKYSKTDTNISDNIIISDYNCRIFSNFKAYGKMEDSCNLIETILKNTYTYHVD